MGTFLGSAGRWCVFLLVLCFAHVFVIYSVIADESEGEEEESKTLVKLAAALGAKEKKKKVSCTCYAAWMLIVCYWGVVQIINPLQWSLGFDRWAIAAAAAGQIKITTAMAHKVRSFLS